MQSPNRIFRVFVSSTFNDLTLERNALQKEAFPRLKVLCESRGCRFQAIDLRWGVGEESVLDHRAMTICMQELQRCKEVSPKINFITLLGDRYGWCPLPSRIPKTEFESLLRKIANDSDLALLAFNEAYPPVNRRTGWYRLDQNARPEPEYVLRPRVPGMVRDALQTSASSELEAEKRDWIERCEIPMRRILIEAIEACGWPPGDPRRRKYEQSATHQEIETGALMEHDCKGHVFAYFRGAAPSDTNESDPVTALKKSLMKTLPPEQIYMFQNSSPDALSQLCTRVVNDLWNVIEAEIDELDKVQSVSPLLRENEAHERFSRDRCRNFVGRQAQLRTLESYLVSKTPHPLIIHGGSGCGKTALVSEAWLNGVTVFSDLGGAGPVVLGRLIGSTPSSTEIRTLLTDLGRQIEAAYLVDPSDIPWDLDAFFFWFAGRLSLAHEKRPLVMFLDALDQLQEHDLGRTLRWLPARLPDHVRIVASVLDEPGGPDGHWFRSVKARYAAAGTPFLHLSLLAPDDSIELLEKWLGEAARSLSPQQWEEVRRAIGEGIQPLWLKVVFHEARGWTSWQVPGEKAGSNSHEETITPLVSDLSHAIDRFVRQLADPRRHQPLLVERSLAYLAASRRGLTEDELLRILPADKEYWDDFTSSIYHEIPGDERCLPAAVWSRLYHDLEGFLSDHFSEGGLLLINFYHRKLKERIEEQFLIGKQRNSRQRVLGGWFSSQPLWVEGHAEAPQRANHRKVSELVYHLVEGEDSEALFGSENGGGIANSLEFLLAKSLCLQGTSYASELSDALRLIGASDPSEAARMARIREYQREWMRYATTPVAERCHPPVLETLPMTDRKQGARHGGDGGRNCEFAIEIRRFLFSNLGFLDELSSQPCSVFFSLADATDHTGLRGAVAEYMARFGGRRIGFQRYLPRMAASLTRGIETRSYPSPGNYTSLRADATLETYAALPNMLAEAIEIRKTATGEVVSIEGEARPLFTFDVSNSGEFTVAQVHPTESELREAIATGKSASLLPLVLIDNVTGSAVRYQIFVEMSAIRILPCESAVLFCSDCGDFYRFDLTGDGDRQPRKIAGVDGKAKDLLAVEGGTRILLRVVSKSGDSGGFVVSLDPESGTEQWRYRTLGEAWTGMDVTPDGKYGVVWKSVHQDGVIDLIDARSGTLLAHFTSPWLCQDAKISHDGKRLIVASDQLQIFDLEPLISSAELPVFAMVSTLFGSPPLTRPGQLGLSTFAPDTVRSFDIEPRALQITPDGGFALVVTERNTIERIDLCSPVDRLATADFDLPVAWIQYGEDENRVIASDFAGNTQVIEVESGIIVDQLQGHSDVIWAVVRGEGWFATGSADSTVRIWDSETLSPLKVLRDHKSEVQSLAFSSEKELLVSGSKDGEIHLWSTSDWELRSRARVPGSPTALEAFPDGDYLAVGLDSGALHLLTLPNLEDIGSGPARHTSRISGICISPDQSKCLTVGHDGKLVSSDLRTGQVLYVNTDANEKTMSVSRIFGDGWVATAGSDFTLSIWKFESGELVSRFPEYGVAHFDVARSGREIIGGSLGPLTRITLGESATISKIGEQASLYGVVRFEDDGKHVVTALGGRIRRSSLESGSALYETMVIDSREPGRYFALVRPYVGEDGTWALHPHPTYANFIKRIDLPSGRERYLLRVHTSTIESMVVCEAKDLGVSYANPFNIEKPMSELCWWSLSSGGLLGRAGEIPGGEFSETLSAIAIGSGCGDILAGTTHGGVYQIDTASGRYLKLFQAGPAKITALASTPDGRVVAAGDASGLLVCYSRDLESTISEARPHRSKVKDLLILPDRRHLLSASEDKTVKLVAITNGKEIATYIARHPVKAIVPCFPKRALAIDAHGVELVRMIGFEEALEEG